MSHMTRVNRPRRLAATALMCSLGLASPLTRAQTSPRLWRIGLLVTGSAPAPGTTSTLSIISTRLAELGHVPGTHVVFEARYADNQADRLPELAQQLVAAKVDVIVTSFTPATHAAKQATRTIPIVMAGTADPVGSGLIASLARPGGNITGMASFGTELAAKCLDFVRELRPNAHRVAVLANAADTFTPGMLAAMQRAAQPLGLNLRTASLRQAGEYPAAFAVWAAERVDALFVQPSLPFKAAVELALAHRLPSISFVRAFAAQGGLMAYGANATQTPRLAAEFVDRIMKGAQPAEMPVRQPTQFDLTINLTTARALGLAVPPALLARAAEVIE